MKSLARASQELASIKETVEHRNRLGQKLGASESDRLRFTQANCDQLEEDIAFLKRLGSHQDMKFAFKELQHTFTSDDQYQRFLYAAWSARIDFSKYKQRLRQAKGLAMQIAETAQLLSEKINALYKTHTDLPSELDSIDLLLRKTENRANQNHNFEMWRKHRGVILGDPPSQDHENVLINDRETALDQLEKLARRVSGEQVEDDELEKNRSDLKYAWTLAPNFAALLSTLSEVMENFEPKEHGFIGAGVASREHNEKTAYIRAFYTLLHAESGIEISLPVRKAMANVTTVMLNRRDIEATLDDVTKAIASLEHRIST